MKKKISQNLPQTKKEILEFGLVSALFLLIIAALAWWQFSPYTFREFDTTCQHFSYADCMRWFYNTKPFYQRSMIISLVAAAIALASTLYLYFKKKK